MDSNTPTQEKIALMRERLANSDWCANHPGLRNLYETILRSCIRT